MLRTEPVPPWTPGLSPPSGFRYAEHGISSIADAAASRFLASCRTASIPTRWKLLKPAGAGSEDGAFSAKARAPRAYGTSASEQGFSVFRLLKHHRFLKPRAFATLLEIPRRPLKRSTCIDALRRYASRQPMAAKHIDQLVETFQGCSGGLPRHNIGEYTSSVSASMTKYAISCSDFG